MTQRVKKLRECSDALRQLNVTRTRVLVKQYTKPMCAGVRGASLNNNNFLWLTEKKILLIKRPFFALSA